MLVRAVFCAALLVAPFAASAEETTSVEGEYQHQLDVYNRARIEYEARTAPYWSTVYEKRKLRVQKRRAGQAITLQDYVLEQPVAYSGPPEPVDPKGGCRRSRFPLLADFLRHAKEEFDFEPERVSEMEFKRTYARLAFDEASSNGILLTKSQVVRIYSFETGGGDYDMQAGMNRKKCPVPISTALGYNQLLNANSIGVLVKHGPEIVSRLMNRARHFEGDEKAQIIKKAEALRRMVAYCRSLPDSWSAHVAASRTAKGKGIHAALLDIDIGPIMQIRKLVDSIKFANAAGVRREMTAAELEMINFAGPDSGIDMVLMPENMRSLVPTSNFYERAGYERNSILKRSPTVSLLFNEMNHWMDKHSLSKGSRDLESVYPR